MRDLLQPLREPEFYTTDEAASLSDFAERRTKQIGRSDIEIGAERWSWFLDDVVLSSELLPLLSAVARGQTLSAAIELAKLRGRYIEHIRLDTDLQDEIEREWQEGDGHA